MTDAVRPVSVMSRNKLRTLVAAAQPFVNGDYQECADIGHTADWWRAVCEALLLCRCGQPHAWSRAGLCEGCICAAEDAIGDSHFGDS